MILFKCDIEIQIGLETSCNFTYFPENDNYQLYIFKYNLYSTQKEQNKIIVPKPKTKNQLLNNKLSSIKTQINTEANLQKQLHQLLEQNNNKLGLFVKDFENKNKDKFISGKWFVAKNQIVTSNIISPQINFTNAIFFKYSDGLKNFDQPKSTEKQFYIKTDQIKNAQIPQENLVSMEDFQNVCTYVLARYLLYVDKHESKNLNTKNIYSHFLQFIDNTSINSDNHNEQYSSFIHQDFSIFIKILNNNNNKFKSKDDISDKPQYLAIYGLIKINLLSLAFIDGIKKFVKTHFLLFGVGFIYNNVGIELLIDIYYVYRLISKITALSLDVDCTKLEKGIKYIKCLLYFLGFFQVISVLIPFGRYTILLGIDFARMTIILSFRISLTIVANLRRNQGKYNKQFANYINNISDNLKEEEVDINRSLIASQSNFNS